MGAGRNGKRGKGENVLVLRTLGFFSGRRIFFWSGEEVRNMADFCVSEGRVSCYPHFRRDKRKLGFLCKQFRPISTLGKILHSHGKKHYFSPNHEPSNQSPLFQISIHFTATRPRKFPSPKVEQNPHTPLHTSFMISKGLPSTLFLGNSDYPI